MMMGNGRECLVDDVKSLTSNLLLSCSLYLVPTAYNHNTPSHFFSASFFSTEIA